MTGQFDVRDLRRPLDVFTRDEVFLGSIVKIVAADRPGDRPADGPTDVPGAVAEDGQPATRQTSQISGEMLGPMPTAPLGNPGPAAQSAARGYRAEPDDAETLVGGSMVVGTWWGLIGRRTIGLEQIMSLSLERVILKQTYEEISGGRRAPSRGSGH